MNVSNYFIFSPVTLLDLYMSNVRCELILSMLNIDCELLSCKRRPKQNFIFYKALGALLFLL